MSTAIQAQPRPSPETPTHPLSPYRQYQSESHRGALPPSPPSPSCTQLPWGCSPFLHPVRACAGWQGVCTWVGSVCGTGAAISSIGCKDTKTMMRGVAATVCVPPSQQDPAPCDHLPCPETCRTRSGPSPRAARAAPLPRHDRTSHGRSAIGGGPNRPRASACLQTQRLHILNPPAPQPGSGVGY